MLSRIADSLYWMSRYLERAGNTARLIEINLLYLLEAEDDFEVGFEDRATAADLNAIGRAQFGLA